VPQIAEHVWWMPPGPPDRPSLCAVVGRRWTLLLDAGSSRAHARTFLDELPERPRAVVYTHSHWDHVLGGAEVGGVVVAHRLTAAGLLELAARDWSDEGLADYRYAAHVMEELPAPRVVEIAPADVVFDDAVGFDLGGVTVHVRHVASDHCPDACVMHVEPDGVLFLGDCVSASPDGRLTRDVALPLYETILGFDAELHVEGHHPAVESRTEMELLIEAARAAARGETGAHEDAEYFVEAFRLGS
jgi:glyoxylase-like metal-dependent hydrolase (beta-lactamase superfamily II)